MLQQAAKEMVGQGRQSRRPLGIGEEIVASGIPQGGVQMGTVAGQVRQGLGPEAGSQAMAFGDRRHHHPKKGMAIGCQQRTCKGPVDFELAVGIFMVSLIRAPAQLLHAIQQFGDQRVMAHQGQLVVAGFALPVAAIGDDIGSFFEQKELRFNPGAQLQPQGCGALQLALQHQPRRLLQGHSPHLQVGGHPGHLGLPGQHHQAGGIGDCQHIRVGRRHRQPGGETGESRPALGQVGGGSSGHELGPLHPEQIAERKQEMADAMGGGEADQIVHGDEIRELLS